MFEDKAWSNELKVFAAEIHGRGMNSTKEEFTKLIDLALAEGRQQVCDDPKRFSLGNCEDCDERRRADEPRHNEGME